jgi:hypothetical protein
MLPITDEAELQRILADGKGYIYSIFSSAGGSGARYNILHRACCADLVTADPQVGAYFAADLQEALTWLDANWACTWRVCPVCAP